MDHLICVSCGHDLAECQGECNCLACNAERQAQLSDGSGQLLTSEDVARELGIDPSRVRRIAANRGLGQQVGRTWVFTHRDLEAMRERRPGWPKGRPRSTSAPHSAR